MSLDKLPLLVRDQILDQMRRCDRVKFGRLSKRTHSDFLDYNEHQKLKQLYIAEQLFRNAPGHAVSVKYKKGIATIDADMEIIENNGTFQADILMSFYLDYYDDCYGYGYIDGDQGIFIHHMMCKTLEDATSTVIQYLAKWLEIKDTSSRYWEVMFDRLEKEIDAQERKERKENAMRKDALEEDLQRRYFGWMREEEWKTSEKIRRENARKRKYKRHH
jgi:hypothetical protein